MGSSIFLICDFVVGLPLLFCETILLYVSLFFLKDGSSSFTSVGGKYSCDVCFLMARSSLEEEGIYYCWEKERWVYVCGAVFVSLLALMRIPARIEGFPPPAKPE